MTVFLELLQMALVSMITIFISPFFWLVLFIVYSQYKKMYEMEKYILGEAGRTVKERVRNALIIGMLGGFIGTIMIMLLGISLNPKDLIFIFPMAVLLMLIHVRYICFSYAGGLLALSSLLFDFPQIHVPSIMAIIAILHLVECILIWLDGHKDAVPIFLEDKRFGVVGGFILQRFWPIPFAVLFIIAGSLEGAREIHLPDWWPIFKRNVYIEHISLQVSAVVAALGYGDLSIIRLPREKSKKSSKRLLIYSILLLLFSILSTKLRIFQFVAAVFAPLGHEVLILYGQKEEKRGIPIFRQHSQGVTILYVQENMPGEKMKLRPGEVIIRINNHDVNNKSDIQEILKQYPPYIWLEIIDINGQKRIVEYENYRTGIGSLGIVLISNEINMLFNPRNSISPLKKLLQKLFSNHKRSI